MGSLIGSYFSAYDWHNGSVISLVLLLIIGLITWLSNQVTRFEPEPEKKTKRVLQ